MPIALEEFVNLSVMDTGPEWVGRFHAVMHHIATHDECTIVQGDDSTDGEWYLAANDLLLDRARTVAGRETIVALTVRPPEGEDPPSVTDHFAARAERLGMLVLCVDPRPGSSSAVSVG
jgi:hypothetical protein